MRSPYETKIILLLKATAIAGALAARHECPGARPFPSALTQRLFLSLATREVLIGGLPAGERDLTGVVIRRQQVLLLAGAPLFTTLLDDAPPLPPLPRRPLPTCRCLVTGR